MAMMLRAGTDQCRRAQLGKLFPRPRSLPAWRALKEDWGRNCGLG